MKYLWNLFVALMPILSVIAIPIITIVLIVKFSHKTKDTPEENRRFEIRQEIHDGWRLVIIKDKNTGKEYLSDDGLIELK